MGVFENLWILDRHVPIHFQLDSAHWISISFLPVTRAFHHIGAVDPSICIWRFIPNFVLPLTCMDERDPAIRHADDYSSEAVVADDGSDLARQRHETPETGA